MTVAIPVIGGKLSSHFGHCDRFTLFAVADKTVTGRQDLTPPQDPEEAVRSYLQGTLETGDNACDH